MYPKEIGINTRNLVDSFQDWDYWIGLVNMALNLRVPWAMELVSYLNFIRSALMTISNIAGQIIGIRIMMDNFLDCGLEN